MEIKKIYLDKAKKGYIVCEQCGKAQEIDASKFKANKRFRVTCKCKNLFYVEFEHREYYRKKVNLRGVFVRTYPDQAEKGRIIIQDISISGLSFATVDHNPLKKGDVLTLSFVLDNARSSDINVNGIVRAVHERDVGLEFQKLDVHTQKLLGFYLMP